MLNKKLFVTLSLLSFSALIFTSCMGGGGGKRSSASALSNTASDEQECSSGNIVLMGGQFVCLTDESGNNECQIDSDCDTGEECTLDAINGNKCEPVQTSEETCTSSTQCLNSQYCDPVDDVCKARQAIYGTACSGSLYSICSRYCASGKHFTDGSTRKCGCSANAQCTPSNSTPPLPADRNTCNLSTGRCVKVIQAGGTGCSDTTNTVCAANTSCSSNTCKKLNGQSCTVATQSLCLSGYCDPSTLKCAAAGNQACSDDSLDYLANCASPIVPTCCKSHICRSDNKCGCRYNQDCTATQYCDPSDGFCKEGCSPIGLCLVNNALVPCDPIIGTCGNGYYCNAGGIGGTIGNCLPFCNNPPSLPQGPCTDTNTFCSSNGICTPKVGYGSTIPTGIQASAACSSGLAQSGVTPAICGCDPAAPTFCSTYVSGTNYCDASDYKCKSGCNDSNDCPTNLYCVNSTCVQGCPNTACPTGMLCNETTHLCINCTSDAQCGGNTRECVGGLCRDSACVHNSVGYAPCGAPNACNSTQKCTTGTSTCNRLTTGWQWVGCSNSSCHRCI